MINCPKCASYNVLSGKDCVNAASCFDCGWKELNVIDLYVKCLSCGSPDTVIKQIEYRDDERHTEWLCNVCGHTQEDIAPAPAKVKP